MEIKSEQEQLKEGIQAGEIRIRKLTPTECFRLMGFTDADIEKCRAAGISNSQLYKQAGNSITTNCLMALFGQMIPGNENKWRERFGDNNPYASCEKCGVATTCENHNGAECGYKCYVSAVAESEE